MATRSSIAAILLSAGAVLAASAAPAWAGSQCFKNLDDRPIYITLRYANGDVLIMNLRPGEKRRFNNVNHGDAYCYSFNPITEDECPNRDSVHLDSCTDPRLTR